MTPMSRCVRCRATTDEAHTLWPLVAFMPLLPEQPGRGAWSAVPVCRPCLYRTSLGGLALWSVIGFACWAGCNSPTL